MWVLVPMSHLLSTSVSYGYLQCQVFNSSFAGDGLGMGYKYDEDSLAFLGEVEWSGQSDRLAYPKADEFRVGVLSPM